MKLLEGISSALVQTERLKVHYLERPGAGPTVLFVHGNVSSGAFWQEIMQDMGSEYRALAPDLRGYGETEALPIDATAGLDDMVQDLVSFVKALKLNSFHLAGHSMGGGIVMKLAMVMPEKLLSVTLVDPMSPYGFAGSKGPEGSPSYADGAPAGAAGVNPDFIKLLARKYNKGDEQMAPVNVFRSFYIKPPFQAPNEEMFLESMLSTRVGDDWYPGNFEASTNWPGAAPGTKGVANAFARKYFDASAFMNINPKPPVLWVRGEEDQIVSNNSMFDISALGALGAVPGWPGEDACPPQPMLDQTRGVLESYRKNGGRYREEVIADAGHSPFIDQKSEFKKIFFPFLKV
ncbi:MAG: alpha/beta hydrolase [Pseudomonadota bacterium]